MIVPAEMAVVYHWVKDYRHYADYDNTNADALLADLQSTTSHIQQYQHNEAASREETPPPLPPHPDMYDQNIYETQQIKQPMHSTTTVVTKVNNNTMPTNPQRSSLSNNLSELDTLLQDLSSAQFMAEVDRRNSGTANGYQDEELITPTTRAPPRDRTVDSLLDELDKQDPGMNHYEQVNVSRQHHSYNSPSQMVAPSKPPAPPPGASTATRELDDLMASLSEFKMGTPGHTGDPPYAQPHKIPRPELDRQPQHSPGNHSNPSPSSRGGGGGGGMYTGPNNGQTTDMYTGQNSQYPAQNGQYSQEDHIVRTAASRQQHMNATMQDGSGNLEAMLGNLSTDMSNQGVMTVPKGHCAACSKPIIGQVITALGRIWHPEHFNCTHCKIELGTQNFFERDGQPFCERDYHMLFSPRCAFCNGPILDKCITALDKSWHPEHFVCAHCKRPFGEDGFHERDGLAYCRDDYFEMFAPKCGGCERPIMENYISALNKQWHPECFVCYECRMSFGASSFFDHDGFPYCETHYHAKRGSLCAGCQKPISGRCITAMYKKFHPEHFVCAFCLKQLNKGTFKEQNDKPYCHPCFVKLFG